MLDFNTLQEKGFSQDQINQITKINSETVLTNIDNIPSFVTCEKLRELKKNLLESKFSPLQESILYNGLDANLDITIYANPAYSAEKMQVILDALLMGVDVEYYKEEYDKDDVYDHEEDLKIIFDGIKQGLDVSKYSSINYNYEQKVQIKNGLEANLDVSIYADPGFDEDQMAILFKALRLNLDVSRLANKEYTYQKMEMIFNALKQGIDILPKITPKYSAEQIKQLIKGVESGIDIDKYNNIEYSPLKMRAIRKILEYNKANNKNMSYEIYLNVTDDEEIDRIRNILKNGTQEEKTNLYLSYKKNT